MKDYGNKHPRWEEDSESSASEMVRAVFTLLLFGVIAIGVCFTLVIAICS